MAFTLLKRFALSLSLVLAAPMRAHAWRGGRGPSSGAEADIFMGVCFVIFLGGVIGVAWGARRPAWGALTGFVAGSVGGFFAIILGVVAYALFA
jgi:hypothetical protein